MRVNVYAEEMTDRVEIVTKVIDGEEYTGLRIYLELPVTQCLHKGTEHIRGPFIHRIGDDDSSAITFWGKKDLRTTLQKMITELDNHLVSRMRNRNEESVRYENKGEKR